MRDAENAPDDRLQIILGRALAEHEAVARIGDERLQAPLEHPHVIAVMALVELAHHLVEQAQEIEHPVRRWGIE